MGTFYAQFNKKFSDRQLELVVSKKSFIELARKARITKKKERALYKNFEILEKKKLIAYENRSLVLTEKGERLFEGLRENLEPYIKVSSILSSDDVLKYTRRAQTIFKKM